MQIKRRLLRSIRSTGKLFIIPLLVNWIIIPLLVTLSFIKNGLNEQVFILMRDFSQYFTPLFSTWWILFSFSEYIESDGNEILFIDEKVKDKDFYVLIIAYIISLIPPFIFYIILFPQMLVELLIVIIQCLFFSTLAYFLVFLSCSVPITFLSMIGYVIVSIFLTKGDNIFIYYHYSNPNLSLLIDKYLLYFLISIVLLFIAKKENKQYEHFN